MKKLFTRCSLALGVVFAAVFSLQAAAADITVGGKNFTEQLLLSSMTSQYLKAKGYSVDLKNGLGSVVMRQALVSGQLDVAWEYTGTALIVYDKVKTKLDRDATYQTVKRLDAKRGLIWLNPADLNDTYAFAMQRKVADADGIDSVSDLVKKLKTDPKVKNYVFASDMEFVGRPDGLRPMEKLYGFRFKRSHVRQMDPGLVYTSLRDGRVQIGLVYTTDGRNKGFDFKVLKDDKHFFPAYAATPVVREATLKKYPKLAEQLNALSAKLNDQVMTKLNAEVDIDKQPVNKVAADFLRAQGLI